MAILVFYAKIVLNGLILTGPVTTQDFEEFLFRNTGSSLDFYFTLKKGDLGWSFSGQGIEEQNAIEQVGNQIDQQLVMR